MQVLSLAVTIVLAIIAAVTIGKHIHYLRMQPAAGSAMGATLSVERLTLVYLLKRADQDGVDCMVLHKLLVHVLFQHCKTCMV